MRMPGAPVAPAVGALATVGFTALAGVAEAGGDVALSAALLLDRIKPSIERRVSLADMTAMIAVPRCPKIGRLQPCDTH